MCDDDIDEDEDEAENEDGACAFRKFLSDNAEADQMIADFREKVIHRWHRFSYYDDYLYYCNGGAFRPAEPSQAQAREPSEARRGWAK